VQPVGGCKRALQELAVEHCKRAYEVQLEGGCKRALQELLVEHRSQVLEGQLGGCWRMCQQIQLVACGTQQMWKQAPCIPSLLWVPGPVLRLQVQVC